MIIAGGQNSVHICHNNNTGNNDMPLGGGAYLLVRAQTQRQVKVRPAHAAAQGHANNNLVVMSTAVRT